MWITNEGMTQILYEVKKLQAVDMKHRASEFIFVYHALKVTNKHLQVKKIFTGAKPSDPKTGKGEEGKKGEGR